MTVKLLAEHDLEFLSLKGGCTGSPESIHVKLPHCWKSHVMAQLFDKPSFTFSRRWNSDGRKTKRTERNNMLES